MEGHLLPPKQQQWVLNELAKMSADPDGFEADNPLRPMNSVSTWMKWYDQWCEQWSADHEGEVAPLPVVVGSGIQKRAEGQEETTYYTLWLPHWDRTNVYKVWGVTCLNDLLTFKPDFIPCLINFKRGVSQRDSSKMFYTCTHHKLSDRLIAAFPAHIREHIKKHMKDYGLHPTKRKSHDATPQQDPPYVVGEEAEEEDWSPPKKRAVSTGLGNRGGGLVC
jgi:hypothetical protein